MSVRAAAKKQHQVTVPQKLLRFLRKRGYKELLGDKVREARKSKHITLEQLAEASGLTASYISQLERNLTEPSISSLRKIAQELQMPIYAFLEEESPQTFVIRRGRRKSLRLEQSGIEYEYLTPLGANRNPMMEIVEFKLKPGKWTNDDYLRHSLSEECIVVLEGALTVDCMDQTYILEQGDSIYLNNNTPHNIYNHTDKNAAALFFATPPVL